MDPLRRFYQTVATRAVAEGVTVTLDGRSLKTPAQRLLLMPTAALAEAVAAEWQVQGPEIQVDTMPMMQLATTALDRVAPNRAAILDEIAAFGESDLLCHRADHPEDLVRRQRAAWQPVLDWAATTLALSLQITTGVMPLRQPPATLASLRTILDGFDDFALTALHMATTSGGSVIVALALAHGRLQPEQAWAITHIDEIYQREQWGQEDESTKRLKQRERDLQEAARFWSLLSGKKDRNDRPTIA